MEKRKKVEEEEKEEEEEGRDEWVRSNNKLIWEEQSNTSCALNL